ncbi:MAG: NAD-dependent epimerase/dehydratase family protein [Gemmatimonadales bacterium]
MLTRRTFVRNTSAALGAMGAFGPLPRGLARSSSKLRVLILGGTGFTGPFHVASAVARGHQVTVFNRGRRQTDLPDGVEQLRGDRATGDLTALRGKRWDVVIDIPTTLPRWVRDAGEVLAEAAERYVFISTISVYGDPAGPPDERTPVEQWKGPGDPLQIREFNGALLEHYGALKALAEREAERWFPGRTVVVRPGLIVGPRDNIDRFTYWVTRIDRGGEVLAPGNPTDPTQVIDARDLAEWVVRMAESGAPGSYNATGPRARLSMAELLYGIRAATSGDNDVRFTWADADFLEANKVSAFQEMPLWLPPKSASGPVLETRIEKAVAAGLSFRPLAVTARDTLEFAKTLPSERLGKLRAGLTPEREAELLAAWHRRAG